MNQDKRAHVHQLIDHLPAGQLAAIETLLESMVDDEELTEEDRRSLHASDSTSGMAGGGRSLRASCCRTGFHHGADSRRQPPRVGPVVKRISFEPEVQAQIRAIPQHNAMTILQAIHHYADTGNGPRKAAVRRVRGLPSASYRQPSRLS